MACECTRPLTSCSPLREGKYLLLWPPMLHTAQKIRNAANQLGLTVKDAADQTCVVVEFLTGTTKETLLNHLTHLLTEEELDATQALLSSSVSLSISDVPKVRSLRHLIAAFEHQWFERVIREGRLTSAFQPIVQAGSHQVVGHEALLRARLPNGEEIPAARLLAAARALGQLVQLDVQARLVALERVAQHSLSGLVFINFSPTAVYDPATCLRATWQAAERLDIDPSHIVFEVIETESLTNLRHVNDVLTEYRRHGFRVALDDIGSGYSSLVWLSALQPDFVKIDRQLVQGVSEDPVKQAITSKVVDMAHHIGAIVIAEGIEEEKDARKSEEFGVDLLQGYLFGRPRILD